MVLWGIGLGVAMAARSAWAFALCGAALLHLGLDFLMHHDDGRAHFWPLSDWIFQSPVSYWDPRHYGSLVGPIEIAVSLVCFGVLWRRYVGKAMRGLIAILALAEAAPIIIFGIMFAGG